MTAMSDLQELYCSACDWSELVDLARAIIWLREAKLCSARSDPTPEEIQELLPVAAGKLSCPECQHQPLQLRQPAEEEFDWPEPVACEVCGKPIPPERLEIMPGTKTCVACQQLDESGGATTEVDYCPNCGSPLQVKPRGGAGVARYVMHCGGCGYRSG